MRYFTTLKLTKVLAKKAYFKNSFEKKLKTHLLESCNMAIEHHKCGILKIRKFKQVSKNCALTPSNINILNLNKIPQKTPLHKKLCSPESDGLLHSPVLHRTNQRSSPCRANHKFGS